MPCVMQSLSRMPAATIRHTFLIFRVAWPQARIHLEGLREDGDPIPPPTSRVVGFGAPQGFCPSISITSLSHSERPMTIRYSNPSGVHAPLGLYSHTVAVPEGTELIFLSGQLGVRPDGSTPGTIQEQAEQVFANIIALLKSHGLEATSIIKLTTFMVAGHDGDAVRAARLKYLGSHRPASTAVFVSQLVEPAWFVEVEAIAAKLR